MKMQYVLGMIALTGMSLVGTAQASENVGVLSKEVVKVDVLCKFSEGHDLLGDQGDDEKQRDKRGCFAAATLFKKHGGSDQDKDRNEDILSGDWKNKLAILCDGSVVYADGANVKKRKGTVRIEGLPGPTPAIVLERERGDDGKSVLGGKDEWKKVDAKLELRKDELEGACKVRVTEVERERL